jgi:dolichol-phosphate mannosyltransferase
MILQSDVMKDIGIIIPTYNARNSIVDSIRKIKKTIPDCTLLIVDDNSPDKTAELIKRTFVSDKSIAVLDRPAKGGRGSAVLAGLKHLYANKHINYFIEMDADLCHNPKYIKPMVQKAANADLVIASRYLPDSRIFGWNIKRKLMSFSINTFAKMVLKIPISDYTDGFRCYTRKAVAIISRHKVQSRGYIVLSETAFICYKKGLVFDEIPIDFYFQTVTKSNLNIKEVKEALQTILRLRFAKL